MQIICPGSPTPGLDQGVPDHPKVSPEPFSFTQMIIVLCLKVLDSFGKMSREDVKNTLQIMHLEPRWHINWPIYDKIKKIKKTSQIFPELAKNLKCLPTKN